MTLDSSTSILTLSNTQAKELAGRFVTVGGTKYLFNNYDPDQPGQPPWRSGAEGKAYPLVDSDGSVVAYLKFFTHPTQMRLDRTAWLIGQEMHGWLPNLAAAPMLWTDSRRGVAGARIDFQFAACLAKAVPGETWLERKSGIADGTIRFSEDLRWRCVMDLLLALAVLERAELVHGDLSPNNVIIDWDAGRDTPALYLIDFDAFVAAAAGANRAIPVAEGGTYGTEGYCPPDLPAAVNSGDTSVAPYSDRYGRDMLLLEFLLMGHNLPADDPLAYWNREQLHCQFTAWRARSDPERVRTLSHLDPATVFNLDELQRPTSVHLATGMGLSLPERRVLRRVTELPRPTPATLGARPAGKTGRGNVQRLVPWTSRRGQRLQRAAIPVQPPTPSPRLPFKQKMTTDEWVAFLFIVCLFVLFFTILFLIGVTTPTSSTAAGIVKGHLSSCGMAPDSSKPIFATWLA